MFRNCTCETQKLPAQMLPALSFKQQSQGGHYLQVSNWNAEGTWTGSQEHCGGLIQIARLASIPSCKQESAESASPIFDHPVDGGSRLSGTPPCHPQRTQQGPGCENRDGTPKKVCIIIVMLLTVTACKPVALPARGYVVNAEMTAPRRILRVTWSSLDAADLTPLSRNSLIQWSS